jgi:hypothetical protein
MVWPECGRTREIDPVLLVFSKKPAGVIAEEDFLTIGKEPIVITLVIAFKQLPLEYSHMRRPMLVYCICVAVIDRATKIINTPLKSYQ